MCCIVCVQDFGKYGFIRESDMAAKQAEFMLWATEVKGANVELLGRLEEKELFKEYMEDFNTGTLKHRWARGDTGTWKERNPSTHAQQDGAGTWNSRPHRRRHTNQATSGITFQLCLGGLQTPIAQQYNSLHVGLTSEGYGGAWPTYLG